MTEILQSHDGDTSQTQPGSQIDFSKKTIEVVKQRLISGVRDERVEYDTICGIVNQSTFLSETIAREMDLNHYTIDLDHGILPPEAEQTRVSGSWNPPVKAVVLLGEVDSIQGIIPMIDSLKDEHQLTISLVIAKKCDSAVLAAMLRTRGIGLRNMAAQD